MKKQKMIDVLHFCAAQCTHCYDACHLEKNHDMKLCMMNCQDCAEICRITGHLLENDSANVDIFLKLCAKMCERCAEECEKYPQDHCIKCAEVCRNSMEIFDEY
ncbi:four-helix bundle copper-binding protein [Flavobacterium sp.]|jgi:hypothetical protein|uniref:four-helix bundle copper-binding protein n=1 Tax=Flavobacterium sp. TaxID=239 RepID=UPI0037C025B3